MPGGRPTSLNDALLDNAEHYTDNWEEIGDKLPSVVGLCIHIGISKSTAYKWISEGLSERFSDIYRKVEEMQEKTLVENGLTSIFNPTITKLMLTKHGYSDKQEVDHQSSDGTMTPSKIEIVAPKCPPQD